MVEGTWRELRQRKDEWNRGIRKEFNMPAYCKYWRIEQEEGKGGARAGEGREAFPIRQCSRPCGLL